MRPLQVLRSAFISLCLIAVLIGLCAFGQTFTATQKIDTIAGNASFPDALEAKLEKDGKGLPGKKILAIVKEGDAKIYFDQAPGSRAVGVTDKDGIVKFGMITTTDFPANVTVQVMPVDNEEKILDIGDLKTINFRQATELNSKLTFFQLFVGSTFANNYDTAGHDTGFGNAGQLVRLTFDTMWRHQGFRPVTQTVVTKDKNGVKQTQTIEMPIRKSAIRGNWRTDLNAELSKFPFGATATSTTGTTGTTGTTATTDTNQTGLANAFSGSLGLTWEPNAWAHYDKREGISAENAGFTSLRSDEWPYDVYRVALFAKAGVTTRAQAAPHSGDTSFTRGQIGLRFSHRRSKQSSPEKEDYNVEPIRFVEISFARFSKYDTRLNPSAGAPDARNSINARRMIIDAGLRVGALSNNVFPIYVGVHLNTGPGRDDLRLFFGVLMKLDELWKLVQSSGANTTIPK